MGYVGLVAVVAGLISGISGHFLNETYDQLYVHSITLPAKQQMALLITQIIDSVLFNAFLTAFVSAIARRRNITQAGLI